MIRDGRVLLAARANEPMRGVWTLPGGLVEAGEALASAAFRELQEEVGAVGPSVIGVADPTEIIVRDEAGRVRHHYVVHPHAALWRGGEPCPAPRPWRCAGPSPRRSRRCATTPGLDGTLAEAFAAAARHRAETLA